MAERIEAPSTWPGELLVIAAAVALAAALGDRLPDTLGAAIVLHPAWEALGGLDTELRRRRARQLEITPENLPPSATVDGGIFYVVGTFVPWARRKLRGEPAPNPSWSLYLAARLISAFNERRSWNAATRRLRFSPSKSDSFRSVATLGRC